MFRSDGLFSRFMNVLFDILYVGILWIVCCVPIVTAGAAATAAYYTMAKTVRYKTGYVGREFFHSFKSNLKQTIPLTLAFVFIAVVLGIDVWYVWVNDSKGNSALFMVLVFVMFVEAGVISYIFPLLSRFDKRNFELLKIALFIMFKYLPLTLGMIVLFLMFCMGIYLMPWAILVFPGIYIYLLSYPMERILRKMMPPVEEGSEEAEKWYYQ